MVDPSLPPPPDQKRERRRKTNKRILAWFGIALGAVTATAVVLGVLSASLGWEDSEKPVAVAATYRPAPDPSVTPRPHTTVRNPSGYTPARKPSATASQRPGFCRHYDAWQRATATADRLERKNGDDASTWPARDLAAWFDAVEDHGDAAARLWDTAPSGHNWADVKQAC